MDLDVSVDARGIVRKENGRPVVFSFFTKKKRCSPGESGEILRHFGKGIIERVWDFFFQNEKTL